MADHFGLDLGRIDYSAVSHTDPDIYTMICKLDSSGEELIHVDFPFIPADSLKSLQELPDCNIVKYLGTSCSAQVTSVTELGHGFAIVKAVRDAEYGSYNINAAITIVSMWIVTNFVVTHPGNFKYY